MTAPVVTAEVADCVASHTAWMTALAALSPYGTWQDGPLHWASSADGRSLHGMFPAETPPDVVARGVERADRMGCVEVSIWSAVDVERPELEALGFEVGWQRCRLSDLTRVVAFRTTPRSRCCSHLPARGDRGGSGPFRRRGRDNTCEVGEALSRAWLHVTGAVAGLYDMAIWKKFRRAGYGRDLLAVIGATAREQGAARITLNATPDGEKLYSACGFSRVGVGRTWWRHLRDHDA